MDNRLVLGALLLGACNARLADPGVAAPGHPDARLAPDATVDALVLGAWGTPMPVPGASDATLAEDDCTLSSTMTELYFAIVDASLGTKDLYLMTRATATAPWGTKQKLTALDTTGTEESPRLSPDDLRLYFGRDGDIYVTARATTGAAWGTPTLVPLVSTGVYEKWLAVCDNDYFMVSRANGANGQDLYEGQLGVDAGTVATELNSTSGEISTFLTKDCLTTYFASNRLGGTQLYTSTRANVASVWAAPTLVQDFGVSTDNEDPWMSNDGRAFFFATVRANTTKDLYFSTR